MDPENASQHEKTAGVPLDRAAPETTGVAQMTLEGLRPTTAVLSILYLFVDDRTRALRQRARHLETLISVGHSINGFLKVDALLDHVVEKLHAGFGYERVGVFQADET